MFYGETPKHYVVFRKDIIGSTILYQGFDSIDASRAHSEARKAEPRGCEIVTISTEYKIERNN